jgi:DNA-directed RNA polymerase sigma subunit (sigma70/sigma32)
MTALRSGQLYERDGFIIYCRLCLHPPMSMAQIGEILGISYERVRQIENRIHRKLHYNWRKFAEGRPMPEPRRLKQGRRYE